MSARPGQAFLSSTAAVATAVALVAFTTALAAFLASPREARAETDVRLRITTEGYSKISIGFQDPRSKMDGSVRTSYDEFVKIVKQDLDMSGYFDIVDKISADSPPNAVVATTAERVRQDLTFEVTLADKASDTNIFKRRYGSAGGAVDVAAHIAADEIIFALTGRHGLAKTRIAFVAGQKGDSHLYMAYLDGSQPMRLTGEGSIVMSPCWSPDGTRLAYVSYASGTPAIYVMDVSNLSTVRFAAFEGLNGMPAWSPDGRSIAVTLSKDGNPEIYVIAVDGSYQKRITYYSGIDCSPSWAPSGLELAFTSDRAGTPQIFVTDVDGLNVRQITTEGGYNTSPAWSPDGSLIAYVSRIEGKFQICVIDPFGVRGRVLTWDGNNEDPNWHADGIHLVFSSTGDGNSGIYIVTRDGGAKRKILDGYVRPRNPAWAPPTGEGTRPLSEG
jgi:TolB protein